MLTVVLITCYFVATMGALWWVVAVIRRQHDNDLRYHRNVLLHHVQLELSAQDRRLEERFRASISPCSKGCSSSHP